MIGRIHERKVENLTCNLFMTGVAVMAIMLEETVLRAQAAVCNLLNLRAP